MNPYESYPLQEAMNSMLESVNMLKRFICTMTLPMINTTSTNPVTYAVVTFCKSNDTVFEVSLMTLNQVCVFFVPVNTILPLMLTQSQKNKTNGRPVVVLDVFTSQNPQWFLSGKSELLVYIKS